MEYMLYTEDEIIERVDEYALYCSYLGFEPLIGAKYVSPIRSGTNATQDSDPSFGIFERKYGKGSHEFLWKDLALGIHGDLFDLVKILCKLGTKMEARLQVLIDMGLMPGVRSRVIVESAERKYRGYADIKYVSRAFNHKDVHFWNRINVSLDLLRQYRVESVAAYWLYEDQNWPRYPKGIGFAYNIWDKKQLYFPWETKKRKFRTDWIDTCVPGFLQLKYDSPLLIITKSMKDVLCLRSFGYEAIAARGEGILLPEPCVALMKRRYERVLVLFDNDGKHKGAEYEANWELPQIQIPKLLEGDKDTTDFCANHGIPETADMLRQITGL